MCLSGRAAHSLSKFLTLVAVCSATLAVVAQASAADPVTGIVNAVGTSATQQLDVVAHDATATALPAAPSAAVTQVSANTAQSVAAVPQDVAGAGEIVRSSAAGGEQPQATEQSEGGDRSGSSDARQPSPASSLLAVATRVGRVVTSSAPAPSGHAIVPAARRIVSSQIDRVTNTLAYAEQHAPAARSLAGRASRVAGALLGAVANVAKSTRDTLAAIRVPAVASLLRATVPPPAPPTSLSTSGSGGTSVAPPSVPLTTSLGAIDPAQAAQPSVDGLLAQPVPRPMTTQREASADARGGASDTTLPATSEMPPATSLARAPAGATPAPGEVIPAQPPGDFAPASSASVGGGPSAATFLAFAALLLLATPRALRRLRPNVASWRLAQFSLIPARPG